LDKHFRPLSQELKCSWEYSNLKDTGGVALAALLLILLVGTFLGAFSLYKSVENTKTSTDYMHCQGALTAADGGIDRVMSNLTQTPDSDEDGKYDITPPPEIDKFGRLLFDIDQNGQTDFYQLFDLNKNIPDLEKVDRSAAITLFDKTEYAAHVWVEAQTPSPGMATIHSSATMGRCTKNVRAIIQGIRGGLTPGSEFTVGAPIMNLPPK